MSDVIRFYRIMHPVVEDEYGNFYAELARPEPSAQLHYIDTPQNSTRFPGIFVSWLAEGPPPEDTS